MRCIDKTIKVLYFVAVLLIVGLIVATSVGTYVIEQDIKDS